MEHSLLKEGLARVQREVDSVFDAILPVPQDSRARLVEAMRYAAIGGGKRVRPLLLVSTAEMFGVNRDAALRAACAVEAIHVYSLIHDDLPCMDDDSLRHGKPTVHVEFDEATAVLAGDSLHALAFEILADTDTSEDPFTRSELILTLGTASGKDGMAGGQMMDMMAEGEDYDLHTITRLQQLKTGALLAASVEMGAILGHVQPEGRAALTNLAAALENNPDISILIEGHTDNVPFTPNGQLESNWDLSTKRATAVVAILLNNKNILPENLTAAGRSEFVPIAPNSSAEGRAANRRIEVVLSPSLDEITSLLQTN